MKKKVRNCVDVHAPCLKDNTNTRNYLIYHELDNLNISSFTLSVFMLKGENIEKKSFHMLIFTVNKCEQFPLVFWYHCNYA